MSNERGTKKTHYDTVYIDVLSKCSNELCLFLLKIRKGNPKVEVKGDDILIFIDNELLPAKFEFRKGTLITLEQIGQPTCFQENGV